MTDIAWGEQVNGVRIGIAAPAPGHALHVPMHLANESDAPIWVFGFSETYPRSLRISPPKPHRPYVRVSFADANVLHEPDAFVKVIPGSHASTYLDVGFALDLEAIGSVDLLFAYDECHGKMIRAWNPPAEEEATSGLVTLGA